MKKYVFVIILLILSSMIFAQEEAHHDFSEAIELIEKNIPCDELTDDQFELIGDYYMEQMHPGEAHTRMDEMMGGEGSESLRLMHINMGKNFYCNNNQGMMGGMMMGPGMMYNSGRFVSNNFSWFNFMQGVIVTLLLTVLIITVIILIKGNRK